MSQFSTNELVSLEKSVEHKRAPLRTSPHKIDELYEIDKCLNWIKSNGFERVCLQFPDYMLPDSSEVATKMRKALNQILYILGDTSYESCCIDYVAAAHINADAIIHYGPKCFSVPNGDIPSLSIHEKEELEIQSFKDLLTCKFKATDKISVVLNTPYIWHIEHFTDKFKDLPNINILSIVQDNLNLHDIVIYIGENNRKLLNFSHMFALKELYYYYPNNKKIMNFNDDPVIKKRRNYLIEKIKDSKVIGIVVGTLAIKNYLRVIERLKTLLKLCHKKYYIISVGKPTIAKLANFPEIELYVVVSCAMNEIFDNRDYYQPLVTPYDIEVALNPSSQHINFTYDFNSSVQLSMELNEVEILENSRKNDVSLLTGNVRSFEPQVIKEETDNVVASRPEGVVAINNAYGAGYLNDRTWKGLEQNLGRTEAVLATEGRKGIAQGYENEK